jgi:hypothetical protein
VAVGNSLHEVFLVAAPIALAGCLVAMLVREHPLRGRAEQASRMPAAPAEREPRVAA